MRGVEEAQAQELRSYLRRVGERWPLEAAYHRRRDPDTNTPSAGTRNGR